MRIEFNAQPMFRRCNDISEDYAGEIFLSYSEWLRRDGNVEMFCNPKIEPIEDEL